MHRALVLPEIVTAIVRAGKFEPGLLHSCLLVNKLFFHEACRILWKGCYGIFGVGHVTPAIGDLGRMVLNPDLGRGRAQFYANFIRVLVFQEQESSRLGEDALWHPQLNQLQFPLLEDLNVWRTKSAEELNTENAILHYMHSGLRDLRVDASGPLSDHFLDEVSRLCPRLQQFDMDFQNVTISAGGLARFLQRMHHLEGIHVAALDKSWSATAFTAVSKYQHLTLLHVPSIQDTWFDDIEASTSFPALKQLFVLCTIGKTLLRLHSINPDLEAIHLYNGNFVGPEEVLSAASSFSRLVNFKYQPGPNTAITGRDLVQLACGCPDLIYLDIGQDEAIESDLVDIDNNVISSVAQSLPRLRGFHLIGRSISYPSIEAILSSLNQYCPLLERLEISCGSDWVAFANASPQQWSFSYLCTLSLSPSAHMETMLSDRVCKQLFMQFKSFAPRWFPRMEFFNILDADDREQELNDHMYEVGYRRENGSDTESDEHDSITICKDGDPAIPFV